MLWSSMLVVMMWGMNMNFLERMKIKMISRTPQIVAIAMLKSNAFILVMRV